MANATRIASGIPLPLDFYQALTTQFETVITHHSLNPGGLRVFDGVTEQIRGWIWIPKYNQSTLGSSAFRPMLDLMMALELTLRCTGCHFSGPRSQFFHVGQSWAPNDTLPNPWLDLTGESNDEKLDRWRKPVNYGVHMCGLVALKERLERGSTSFGWVSLANETREHGWLLNPTPRKKRRGPDPVLAELERLGLR